MRRNSLTQVWRSGIVTATLLGILTAGTFGGLPTARAASLTISGASSDQISLQITDDADQWYRIETSIDLQEWRIAMESWGPNTDLQLSLTPEQAVIFRAVNIPIPEPPYRLAITGDSTAVGIAGQAEHTLGWGQPLVNHLHPDARMMIAGEPGLSTKTFFTTRWPGNLERAQPHVVLIQLGQLDEYSRAIEIKRTSFAEYRDNLAGIVHFVRSWNGIPVLVTPLPWRDFQPDGTLDPHLEERSETMRSTARELGVALIDLHSLVAEEYRSRPWDELALWSYKDLYHMSIEGAKEVAKIAIRELPPHLRKLLFEDNLD